MTAAELIQVLQSLPSDTKIVLRGYKDAYNDITSLQPLRLQLRNGGAEWHYGEYEMSERGFAEVESYGENKKRIVYE